MAHHKSAKKRIRQNIKKNARNKSAMSLLRTEIKKITALVNEQKKEEATKALNAVHKIIDKSASKGLIHKNNAARKKSALAISVNKMMSQPSA